MPLNISSRVSTRCQHEQRTEFRCEVSRERADIGSSVQLTFIDSSTQTPLKNPGKIVEKIRNDLADLWISGAQLDTGILEQTSTTVARLRRQSWRRFS